MPIIQRTHTGASLAPLNYQNEQNSGVTVLKSFFKIAAIGVSLAAIGSLVKSYYDVNLSPTLNNIDPSDSLTLKYYNKYSEGCNSIFHKCQTAFFDVFESTSNGVRGSLRAYLADGNFKAFECEYKKLPYINKPEKNSLIKNNMIRELFEKGSKPQTLKFFNLIAKDGFKNKFVYKNKGGLVSEYNCIEQAVFKLVDYSLVEALLKHKVSPEVYVKDIYLNRVTLLSAAISTNAFLLEKDSYDGRMKNIISLLIYYGADVNSCSGRYGRFVSCFKHLKCSSLSDQNIALMYQKGAKGEPCRDIGFYKPVGDAINVLSSIGSTLGSLATGGLKIVQRGLNYIGDTNFLDWLGFEEDFFSKFFEQHKKSDGSYDYKSKSNNNKSEQNHFQYDGKMSYTRALRVLRLSDKPSNTKELKRFCRKRLRDAHPDKMMHTHPKMSLEEASERFIEMTAACEYFKESLFS